jgi:SAM-dependent methyltransferase
MPALELPSSRRESPLVEPSIVARVRPGPSPLVATHDDETYPLYAARFAELLLGVTGPRISGSVLELGCRRGEVTAELVRRHRGKLPTATEGEGPADAHGGNGARNGSSPSSNGLIIGLEGSPGRLSMARARLGDAARSGQVFLRAHEPAQALPFADEMFDLCLSNLVVGDVPDRRRVLADLVRVARPGARVAVALPLDGTFGEVLDLFDEVLLGLSHDEARRALGTYRQGMPPGEKIASELEQLGLQEVEVVVSRWELAFGSSREFFYAPFIEQGPLPRWKAIAGRGEKMHAVFLTLKQSIDHYYAGRSFVVSVVAGCVHGRKPAAASATA